jgi:hypothetical protein
MASRFERIIRAAARDLDGVQNREVSALSGSERRAIIAAGLVAGTQVARGKGPGRAGQAVDRIWTTAETRLRAEITAAATAEQSAVAQAAAAKVAKKKGWF